VHSLVQSDRRTSSPASTWAHTHTTWCVSHSIWIDQKLLFESAGQYNKEISPVFMTKNFLNLSIIKITIQG